ncbi:hypothetical protein [Sansalvadorimonas verongulae]|uniref:hypothetical protein n=1 Tax=Sansalvadorimonas verongulae TaxID=2172824 RepID=UPI0012BD2076|nr:hypothetical protein [Sansalvadorimonas verongulae]
MHDARAAISAIAELNKMSGAYKTSASDLPEVTFIQHFGTSDDAPKKAVLVRGTDT